MPAPLLEARNIVKRFPGVTALRGVSFDLLPGEIHALCGENGAGKSTLIKLLSGIHPAGSYEGELRIHGSTAQLRSLADAQQAGIAVIYQELALVEEMSVAENIFLGNEPRTALGLINWRQTHQNAKELLEKFGVDIDPALPIAELGIGQKQLVEIVKALSKNSRILILDEPTAALAETEVRILLDILRELRNSGIACIYISHRLEEVFSLCDRITVLRDGASILSTPARQISRQELIRHMVGREIEDLFPRRSSPPGRTALAVSNLNVLHPKTRRPFLNAITFSIQAGEVLGLGGLMGAGRTELLMHLFGIWGERVTGSVSVEGAPLESALPSKILARGLALVTEDRRRYGLILDQSIGFNLSLSSLERISRYGLLPPGTETRRNQKLFDSLRIKAPDLNAPVGKLSGGNQQKVVFGKSLLTDPKVVFLDEPTRGIDVGAKLEIYELINQLTDSGKAVVLVSSDLTELLGMSDRIMILRQGSIAGTFSRHEATPENLLATALGSPT
jgi:D-xylose transport system ATP-binding protein